MADSSAPSAALPDDKAEAVQKLQWALRAAVESRVHSWMHPGWKLVYRVMTGTAWTVWPSLKSWPLDWTEDKS